MFSATDPIRLYNRFIRRIDQKIAGLVFRHHKQMKCSFGCSGCCMNLSVLPIEWEAIRKALIDNGISPTFDDKQPCGFLDCNKGCTIYPFRPVICRTHGLPLVYLDDDFNPVIDTCSLNFYDYRNGVKQFRARDVLDMEQINRKLLEINKLHLLNRRGECPERKEMRTLCL